MKGSPKSGSGTFAKGQIKALIYEDNSWGAPALLSFSQGKIKPT